MGLIACASVGNKVFGKKEVPALDAPPGEELKVETASRYEWAIQHYETGQYEDALDGLKAYEDRGPELAGFPLVPFYQGMSHFQLGHCDKAISYLTTFIDANPGLAQSQEARLGLLQCFEKNASWSAIAVRAAESEKFPIYAEDRIRLKLIWTKALFELHEISGAKASLGEVESLVNNFTRDPDHLPELSQNNEDFQARLFHLHTMLELEDCESISAPSKPGKNAQILVDRWLETKGDCLLTATRKALDLGLAFTGDQAERWMNSLSDYYSHYAESSEALAKAKIYANLDDAKAASRPKIRAALYRIGAAIDLKLKDKDATHSIKSALSKLQKSLENLLLQLSLLS